MTLPELCHLFVSFSIIANVVPIKCSLQSSRILVWKRWRQRNGRNARKKLDKRSSICFHFHSAVGILPEMALQHNCADAHMFIEFLVVSRWTWVREVILSRRTQPHPDWFRNETLSSSTKCFRDKRNRFFTADAYAVHVERVVNLRLC